MLGKFFGSEFGKGLVKGAATGFSKQFQDDIDRTKNNIDNLVVESYKGTVESKKEFDRFYKDNRKVVDQIVANLGGEEGANHPKAIDGAYSLINQQGLDNALKYSQKLSKAYQFYGIHPITSLDMGTRTSNGTPVTADLITKSTIDPIVIPNVDALGEKAAVGIMKADFLGGDANFASKEISNRAGALLKARGIDIDETKMELPPALKSKIDPLILGMQDNPTAERARLHIMMNKLDPNDAKYNEKEARIKGMIDSLVSVEKSMKIPKQGLSDTAITRNNKTFQQNAILKYFGPKGLKLDALGQYVSPNVPVDQRNIITNLSNYYVNKLNQAATLNKIGSDEAGSILLKINEAIQKNKTVVIDTDGTVNVGVEDYLDKDKLKILGQEDSNIKKSIPGAGNKNTLIDAIKRNGKNTVIGRKNFNDLVKLIQSENTKLKSREAIAQANQLIK